MSEKEIDFSKVVAFGTSVVDVNDKKGNFKTFHKKNWIQFNDGSKENVEMTLKEIRSHFNSDSIILIKNLKKTRKNIKGKEKTAFIKEYKIQEKGTIFLPKDQFDKLLLCNRKRVQFETKKRFYYYSTKNIYREDDTGKYFYLDESKRSFIDTGMTMFDKIGKSELKEWIENYLESY